MENKRKVTSSLSSWIAVKYFCAYFFPLLMLFGGIAIVLYNKDASSERRLFESNEIHNVNLQMEIITREFESVVADLKWLAGMSELQHMFAGAEANAARVDLMNECLVLCRVKRFYDQIGVLDANGMEVMRVHFNNGAPYVVPLAQLQSKSGRHYLEKMFLLGPGEVFVSPFDVNAEPGKTQKAMLRFGTPVFDSQGSKRGIVLLNYLGANLRAVLDKSHAYYPGEIMLLDSAGFWLHSPNPEDEWGFLFEDKRNRTFGQAFPEAWLRIIANEAGQFHDADGLFTFATLYPLLEARKASAGAGKAIAATSAQSQTRPPYWKVVSHVSPQVLNAGPRKVLGRLLQMSTALIVLLGIASGLLSRARVNRALVEQELRESEQKFRALLESASEAIVIVDSEGGIVLVNHKTEEMFGYDRGELLGQSIEVLVPERFRNGHAEQRAAYLSMPTRRSMGAELALSALRKDGIEFLAEIGLGCAEIHGEIFSICCITDITERKRAAEALEESEQRYRSLFSDAREMIHILDTDGRIIDANTSELETMGYTREEYLGKCLADIIHPDYQAVTKAAFKRVMQGETIEAYETCMITKSKEKVHVEVSAVPQMKDGKVVASRGILRNITERKRAEEQIKNQNVLLEQAVREKQREMEVLMERLIQREKLAAIGEISGSIAHELRNPLSAIRQSIFFLKRLYHNKEITASNSKMQEHLNLLEAEIETSDRVIADLLRKTKMTPLEKEKMNLRSVVLEAVQRCHMDDRIQLEIALNPEPFMLWADPLQIRQVLINLLSNATQAIPQKGVVTVQARMLSDGKACLIEIRDNGAGIEPGQLSKVFEPLYSTKEKGTGLGLSICKQIIENHDGTITVDSQVDRGTTVIVELPCAG